MKNKIGFFGITVLAALMLLATACGDGGDSSGGRSDLAIGNFPGSGKTCYITVYDYAGPVSSLGEMYSSIDLSAICATGKGTAPPITVNKSLNGKFFVTANLSFEYPYRYWDQVQFTDENASLDWNNPTFTYP